MPYLKRMLHDPEWERETTDEGAYRFYVVRNAALRVLRAIGVEASATCREEILEEAAPPAGSSRE